MTIYFDSYANSYLYVKGVGMLSARAQKFYATIQPVLLSALQYAAASVGKYNSARDVIQDYLQNNFSGANAYPMGSSIEPLSVYYVRVGDEPPVLCLGMRDAGDVMTVVIPEDTAPFEIPERVRAFFWSREILFLKPQDILVCP